MLGEQPEQEKVDLIGHGREVASVRSGLPSATRPPYRVGHSMETEAALSANVFSA